MAELMVVELAVYLAVPKVASTVPESVVAMVSCLVEPKAGQSAKHWVEKLDLQKVE